MNAESMKTAFFYGIKRWIFHSNTLPIPSKSFGGFQGWSYAELHGVSLVHKWLK